MLVLVHHQRVIFVMIPSDGSLLVLFKLLLDSLLELLALIVSKLAERADRPSVIQSDVFYCMVRRLLLYIDNLFLTLLLLLRVQTFQGVSTILWHLS